MNTLQFTMKNHKDSPNKLLTALNIHVLYTVLQHSLFGEANLNLKGKWKLL